MNYLILYDATMYWSTTQTHYKTKVSRYVTYDIDAVPRWQCS